MRLRTLIFICMQVMTVSCISSDNDLLHEVSLYKIILDDNTPGKTILEDNNPSKMFLRDGSPNESYCVYKKYCDIGYKTTAHVMLKMRSLNRGYLPLSPHVEKKIAMNLYCKYSYDSDRANRILSNLAERNKIYDPSVREIRDMLNSFYSSPSGDDDDGML